MDYENKPKGYYDNVRLEMLQFLPHDAKVILDVGCGNGAFAEIIKEQNNAEVWGIELMEEHAKEAQKKLDKVFIGKCEDFIESLPDKYFDVIYCNDVLEHLVDPYHVINILKKKLSKKGKIISSLPNVRFFKTFMGVLIKKDWKYEYYGVMDRTHLRFFTKKSIRDMYEDLGFEVLEHKGINRSKSIKPYLFHTLTLFTQLDMQYLQFATVAQIVNEK
ncbi:methyltransferase domain-containing protein [Flaviramulus sp. BrNp1-15]|uniref:class I SAM-dependent methyltransferase n=1 Tax=Flaviramulus sp. BrNp1-15 TaxID=2916754 RepID=UPI001EE8316E|nr:class I SAM-dependent methyltransferase [Flaviramulus sp. BrNp1-15]ULC58702.1 methyltransferase domain-containing protein [Flaviramulus sp. BrNp1-15]